jgi:SAM-dependent methyltransferase
MLKHLEIGRAQRLLDIGAGFGRLCLQAFLEYPALQAVVGVEFSTARYQYGQKALLALYDRLNHKVSGTVEVRDVAQPPRIRLTWTVQGTVRYLELRRGDFLDVVDVVGQSDVVFCDVNVPQHRSFELFRLLETAPKGARLGTYNTPLAPEDRCLQCRMFHGRTHEHHRGAEYAEAVLKGVFQRMAPLRIPTTWSDTYEFSYYRKMKAFTDRFSVHRSQ